MHIIVTPQLVSSLTTLIVAMTALVKLFLVHQTVKDTGAKVDQVEEQTNGSMTEVTAHVRRLEAQIAAGTPASAPAPPPPAGTPPPA